MAFAPLRLAGSSGRCKPRLLGVATTVSFERKKLPPEEIHAEAEGSEGGIRKSGG